MVDKELVVGHLFRSLHLGRGGATALPGGKGDEARKAWKGWQNPLQGQGF